MASLRPDQLLDLVQATQHSYREKKWVDLSMPFQNYYFPRLVRSEDGKKRPQKGGDLLEWKAQVANQGSYRRTGLYNTDVLNKVNLLDNAQIIWAFQDAHYIFDDREPKWNRGEEQIIDLTELYEHGLYNDFFNGIEPDLWSAPTSSAQNPMPLAGFPFWLQRSATAAFGFNGGNPTGFAAGAGGILVADVPAWANGTFTWAVISPADFIAKVVEAMTKCEFKAPSPYPNLVKEAPDWGLYTVYHNIGVMLQLLQAGNENIGDDIAKYMGNPVIKGIPVQYVPALENTASIAQDTTRPFYGINWSTFEYFFKEGESLRKHPMYQSGTAHRVMVRYLDNSGNLVCYNRRGNFFGYDSTV